MPPTQRTLTLSVMDGLFAIAKLPANEVIPAWAVRGPFFALTRTPEELSLVARETAVPEGVQASRGWQMFQVRGPFAFDEIGVVASLAGPLARVGVGIFVISTFGTDYLLVQQEDAPIAVETLLHAGHRIENLELLTSPES
jgi:hypothetical protein